MALCREARREARRLLAAMSRPSSRPCKAASHRVTCLPLVHQCASHTTGERTPSPRTSGPCRALRLTPEPPSRTASALATRATSRHPRSATHLAARGAHRCFPQTTHAWSYLSLLFSTGGAHMCFPQTTHARRHLSLGSTQRWAPAFPRTQRWSPETPLRLPSTCLRA